jgi:hypothetical protein
MMCALEDLISHVRLLVVRKVRPRRIGFAAVLALKIFRLEL